MFISRDFDLYCEIVKSELDAIVPFFLSHAKRLLCEHYLEGFVYYPMGNGTVYVRSSIPLYALTSTKVRGFMHEIVEVEIEGEPQCMSFLEQLYKVWLSFETAILGNVPYCFYNYTQDAHLNRILADITTVDDDHFIHGRIRSISKEIFARAVTDLMEENFESVMVDSYAMYGAKVSDLNFVLAARQLPFSYQEFLLKMANRPPDYIQFVDKRNERLMISHAEEGPFQFARVCLRRMQVLYRRGGSVICMYRSSIKKGIDEPISLYQIESYVASHINLNMIKKFNQVYQRKVCVDGSLSTTLLHQK